MDLKVRYGADTVTILEYDDGHRYEVAHWTEDELEWSPDLHDTIEKATTLAKEDPKELIRRLHGSVAEWQRERENRQWD